MKTHSFLWPLQSDEPLKTSWNFQSYSMSKVDFVNHISQLSLFKGPLCSFICSTYSALWLKKIRRQYGQRNPFTFSFFVFFSMLNSRCFKQLSTDIVINFISETWITWHKSFRLLFLEDLDFTDFTSQQFISSKESCLSTKYRKEFSDLE